MANTFDASLGTDKDYVRFLVGDIASPWVVQDESIEGILTKEANVWMAAAQVAEVMNRILTRGGTLEDRKVGETRIRYRRAADLLALANQLRTRGSSHIKPSAGGIYISDKNAYDADTSLDKPEIAKGMHKHPGRSSLTNKSTSA
jgi:hypothetical protein